MLRNEFLNRLNKILQPELFSDYCPNGLQVQGKGEIAKIVTGVSLNQELLDAAILAQADTIVVHHGIFWNKENPALTGIKYQRVAKLIQNDINLFVYHLPLDNNYLYGNNIGIANALGIKVSGQSGYQNLLWFGELITPLTLNEFTLVYQQKTGHAPMYFGAKDKIIKTIAWCSGSAQDMFKDAINSNVDCYLSGEISEPIMALSKESGVAYIAGGHYVSERFGVIALAELFKEWGLQSQFVEVYNPI